MLAEAADAGEIAARIRRVDPASERRWGTLTAPEMVCHLADAYECSLGRRTAKPAETWFKRTVLKFVALQVPLKWPPGYPTRPEFDPKRDGTRPGTFDADRERAARLAEELAAATTVPPGARHPGFGAMTLAEWKRWGYLHADHHLRQFSA
ncbi:MAG: DUF1569 domain-containing protein [Gemmatimonadales bacterium]